MAAGKNSGRYEDSVMPRLFKRLGIVQITEDLFEAMAGNDSYRKEWVAGLEKRGISTGDCIRFRDGRGFQCPPGLIWGLSLQRTSSCQPSNPVPDRDYGV